MTFWIINAIAVIAAILLAFWSYRRLPVRIPKPWLYSLGTIRAIAIWSLLVLLAEPLYTHNRKYEQRPKIVIVADNTQSVFWGNSFSLDNYRTEIQKIARELTEKGLEVKTYALDRGIKPIDSLTGQGAYSWLSVGIQQALQREGQVQSIILFSDGRESGEQVVMLPEEVPIWTVGVGPPASASDAVLELIQMPSWVSEGQPVQLYVRLRRIIQSAVLRIAFPNGNKSLSVAAGSQEVQINLPPFSAGFHKLNFRLETPNDPNPLNNEKSEILVVYKQKPTFVLWAGEITPDIAFLRRSLDRIGDVKVITARKPTGYTGVPETLLNLSQAIHILYNFPTRSEDIPWAKRLITENNFLCLIWGSVDIPQEFASLIDKTDRSTLFAHPIGAGVSVYLHSAPLPPYAQVIDIGWGHPIGYQVYRGNKLLTVLTGEGWWHMREHPSLTSQWDSLIQALMLQGRAFQQGQIFFGPERARVSPGELVVWKGNLPPNASLWVNGRSLPIAKTESGLSEATWVAESSGIAAYEVRHQGNTLLRGYVWVEETTQELMQIGEDTLWLQNVARKTGGRYLRWEDRARLPAELSSLLPARTLLSSQREVIPFHEWGIWLGVILSLFSLDWLLRRYLGLY
ncbi:MAG: hypothetical protein RMJ66_05565 [Bacteroidia bacterium]|nr:hypothetical protein [Bacteroidia bacterium]